MPLGDTNQSPRPPDKGWTPSPFHPPGPGEQSPLAGEAAGLRPAKRSKSTAAGALPQGYRPPRLNSYLLAGPDPGGGEAGPAGQRRDRVLVLAAAVDHGDHVGAEAAD